MCSRCSGGRWCSLALVAAGLHGTRRALLLGLGTRLQYLFLSVALSGVRCRDPEISHRSRTSVRRRQGRSVQLHPVRGNGGICQPAVGSCGDGVRAGVCGLGAVAAPARVHVHLRNRDPADAAGAARASPERRRGRRSGRHGRRHGGALLVCGPAARLCHPRRRHHCAASGAVSGASKGLPAGHPPHKSGCLPGRRFPGAGQFQPRASICRRPSLRFPSSSPCATKPTTSRR